VQACDSKVLHREERCAADTHTHTHQHAQLTATRLHRHCCTKGGQVGPRDAWVPLLQLRQRQDGGFEPGVLGRLVINWEPGGR